MKEPFPLAHQVASERAAFLLTKPDKALSGARKAIALDANDPAGHLAMAYALIKAKRRGEVVESTKRAMRLDHTTLRSAPPLRTEQATFTALGSSLDRAP